MRQVRKVGKRLGGCVAAIPSPGNSPEGGRVETIGCLWERFQSPVALCVDVEGVWMFVPCMGGGIVRQIPGRCRRLEGERSPRVWGKVAAEIALGWGWTWEEPYLVMW